MARVVIVPGLAIRTYAEPAVAAVAARGHRIDLAPAPAWRGSPADLEHYGTRLARRLEQVGPVDLLVGLSVGTQAAAAGAVDAGPTVRRLLLVSPTVDPVNRSWGRLLSRWVRGDPRAADPPLRAQAGVVHRVQHPAVHRLETVAHVGERAAHDHAHRVVEVASAHLLLEADGQGFFGELGHS